MALLHVLEHLERDRADLPGVVAFLQATAPLTTPDDIDGTVRKITEEGADSALAVAPFHYFLWRVDQSGEAIGVGHDSAIRPLRQQRDPQFIECGSVYAFKTGGFLKAKHRFFGAIGAHVVPGENVLEVDDPSDLAIADLLIRRRDEERAAGHLPSPPSAVIFDFDGVFTDNSVIVLGDGREAVVAGRGDGMGVAMLAERGMPMVVLSTEENPILAARCEKLRLPFQHGLSDKLAAMKSWLEERGLDISRAVYLGNDVNDVPCMLAAGCGMAVADAHDAAQRAAKIVLSKAGGRGAVRELADLIVGVLERKPE